MSSSLLEKERKKKLGQIKCTWNILNKELTSVSNFLLTRDCIYAYSEISLTYISNLYLS